MKKLSIILTTFVLVSLLFGCSAIDKETEGLTIKNISDIDWNLFSASSSSFDHEGDARNGDKFQFASTSNDGIVKRHGEMIAAFKYEIDTTNHSIDLNFTEDPSSPAQYQEEYSGNYDSENLTDLQLRTDIGNRSIWLSVS
ncbi:hypothetical protein [Lacticaseibacillus porcinae]|uniref:hypothetical protein n=1 Tax=Lacticaseibacillus porcinae TaxID=1123687 RepID=UPI000F7A9CDB|nr:hypothetical protein [Lacticaseibacillus porcinae]